MVTSSVAVPQLLVAVAVYVVGDVGLTVIEEVVAPPGVHTIFPTTPVAESVTGLPEQMLWSFETTTAGLGLIVAVTGTRAVEHPGCVTSQS